MARHGTPRRSAAAGPRTRKLWLEQLEGREAPSLLFDGFPTTPLEAPLALAPAAVTNVEPRRPTATHTAGAPEASRDAEAGDRFWTLAWDPKGMRFADLPLNDPGAGGAGGGGTTGARFVGRMIGPEIVDFYASEGEGGWWTFTGRVETYSPGGLIVSLGGLDSLRQQSVEVNEDGTFSITVQLRRTPVCEEGIATARTSDWDGQASNVAEDYVYQTNCPR